MEQFIDAGGRVIGSGGNQRFGGEYLTVFVNDRLAEQEEQPALFAGLEDTA